MRKGHGENKADDLKTIIENLEPGDRHELKDANGRVVAVLGAPTDEVAEVSPDTGDGDGDGKPPHSAWLE